jgi:hypothetical protein
MRLEDAKSCNLVPPTYPTCALVPCLKMPLTLATELVFDDCGCLYFSKHVCDGLVCDDATTIAPLEQLPECRLPLHGGRFATWDYFGETIELNDGHG